MEVYVFKTSVHTPEEYQLLKGLITTKFPAVQKWSIDLEDCDKVLRVESWTDITRLLIQELKSIDICATELDK